VRVSKARSADAYVVDEHGCWIWQWAKLDTGYGRLWDGTKIVQAHRYYFEQHVRPLGEDEHVHHRCNMPSCVNPKHLEALNAFEHKSRHGQWKAELVRIALDSGLSLDEIRTRLEVV
jgi:hypothetical protein